jgi:DNA-binding transcriptional MerR regulator
MSSDVSVEDTSLQWSIHELSRDTGMRVETIRYYQSRGLLHPPRREGRLARYDRSHRLRLQQLQELRERGWSLQAIAEQLTKEQMALETGDTDRASWLLSGRYDLAELGEKTHIPIPILSALIKEGILRPIDPGAGTFTNADVALGRLGLELLGTGIALPSLLALSNRFIRAIDPIVSEAVELFDDSIRSDGASDDEVMARFDEVFELVTKLVSLYFQRTLAATALAQVEESPQRSLVKLVHDRIDAEEESPQR